MTLTKPIQNLHNITNQHSKNRLPPRKPPRNPNIKSIKFRPLSKAISKYRNWCIFNGSWHGKILAKSVMQIFSSLLSYDTVFCSCVLLCSLSITLLHRSHQTRRRRHTLGVSYQLLNYLTFCFFLFFCCCCSENCLAFKFFSWLSPSFTKAAIGSCHVSLLVY